MELEQKLKTAEKEIEENSKALEHWRNEHDKLKLEEIE
jgi:structural maintenance of chromosome 4